MALWVIQGRYVVVLVCIGLQSIIFTLSGDCCLYSSQKGNWTSFRNEMWNNQPVIIDSCFMQNLPTSGHVEFDYIGMFIFGARSFFSFILLVSIVTL